MMRFDDFDKQMRIYETSIDQYILPDMFLVARLDGRTFTRLTREIYHFEAPFDEKFRDYMTTTVRHLMNCGFSIAYGYTESDEISLLFAVNDNTFSRKVRKINSILAGEASAAFSLAIGRLCAFDCRAVPLPNIARVKDYFLWRQEDAHRNSLNSYCYWNLRKSGWSKNEATKEVEGKSAAEKNELLFQMGINYDKVPDWQKRGVGIYYKDVIKAGYDPIKRKTVDVVRRELTNDYNLPVNTEYESFIEQFIK